MTEERANFALPMDGVDTTFDAAIDGGTTVVEVQLFEETERSFGDNCPDQ